MAHWRCPRCGHRHTAEPDRQAKKRPLCPECDYPMRLAVRGESPKAVRRKCVHCGFRETLPSDRVPAEPGVCPKCGHEMRVRVRLGRAPRSARAGAMLAVLAALTLGVLLGPLLFEGLLMHVGRVGLPGKFTTPGPQVVEMVAFASAVLGGVICAVLTALGVRALSRR